MSFWLADYCPAEEIDRLSIRWRLMNRLHWPEVETLKENNYITIDDHTGTLSDSFRSVRRSFSSP